MCNGWVKEYKMVLKLNLGLEVAEIQVAEHYCAMYEG